MLSGIFREKLEQQNEKVEKCLDALFGYVWS